MPPTTPRSPTAPSVLLLWGVATLGCSGQDSIGPDTADSGGTNSLDCDGVEVPWPVDQRVREATVFDQINALRTQGIEAGGSLCGGEPYSPVSAITWHEELARNLQCAMWRDRSAGKIQSDWDLTDLAEGTDLVVLGSWYEDCGSAGADPGCIWADWAVIEDPVAGEWLGRASHCWFPMAGSYDVGAVGTGAGWGTNEVTWMLVLAYPANQ